MVERKMELTYVRKIRSRVLRYVAVDDIEKSAPFERLEIGSLPLANYILRFSAKPQKNQTLVPAKISDVKVDSRKRNHSTSSYPQKQFIVQSLEVGILSNVSRRTNCSTRQFSAVINLQQPPTLFLHAPALLRKFISAARWGPPPCVRGHWRRATTVLPRVEL